MAEYDLTYKVASYLDRHLIFPMLEFLTEKKVRMATAVGGVWKIFCACTDL